MPVTVSPAMVSAVTTATCPSVDRDHRHDEREEPEDERVLGQHGPDRVADVDVALVRRWAAIELAISGTSVPSATSATPDDERRRPERRGERARIGDGHVATDDGDGEAPQEQDDLERDLHRSRTSASRCRLCEAMPNVRGSYRDGRMAL
jgi:hypothetical protein